MASPNEVFEYDLTEDAFHEIRLHVPLPFARAILDGNPRRWSQVVELYHDQYADSTLPDAQSAKLAILKAADKEERFHDVVHAFAQLADAVDRPVSIPHVANIPQEQAAFRLLVSHALMPREGLGRKPTANAVEEITRYFVARVPNNAFGDAAERFIKDSAFNHPDICGDWNALCLHLKRRYAATTSEYAVIARLLLAGAKADGVGEQLAVKLGIRFY